MSVSTEVLRRRNPADPIDLMKDAAPPIEEEAIPGDILKQAEETLSAKPEKPKPSTAREAAEVFFGPEAVHNAEAAEILERRGLIVPNEQPAGAPEPDPGAMVTPIRPPSLPAGQGFELRGEPYSPYVRELEKSAPTTAALPGTGKQYGEGFTFTETEPEQPIVAKSGEVYKTEKAARSAGDKRGIDWSIYNIIPQDGGFSIARKLGAPLKAQKALTIDQIHQAGNEAATSPTNDLPQPTEAQKEAGNYKKGHIVLNGLDISIENPKGSTRSGYDENGKKWESTMTHHYGYIRSLKPSAIEKPPSYISTEGKDGDHLDVFIGEHPESQTVFVIDQINPKTKVFDEHKIMLSFSNEQEARKGYLDNYQRGWKGLGAITAMPMGEFKKWVKSGRKTKPVAYGETPVVRLGAGTSADSASLEKERALKWARKDLARFPAQMPPDASLAVLRGAAQSGKLDPDEMVVLAKIIEKKQPAPPTPSHGQVPAEKQTRPPGASFPAAAVARKKGNENAQTFLEHRGGVDFSADYNRREIRQNSNLKRLYRRTGLKPDEAAAQLNEEGIVSPTGEPWTADSLKEATESGELRKSFTPDKQDVMLENQIRRAENEWIEKELSKLEDIEPGEIRANLSDIQDRLSEEITQEGFDQPAYQDAALAELDAFFTEKAAVQAKSESEIQTEKVTADGKRAEQAVIPGASSAETFGLTASPGEVGPKTSHQKAAPKQEIVFAPEPEGAAEQYRTEAPKGQSITLETVESVFPGQKVEQDGNLFTVTLKNGLMAEIERVPEIIPIARDLAQGHGQTRLSDGEYISGVYIRREGDSKRGRIKIVNRAGRVDLHHESIHFLDDFGILNSREKAVIDKKARETYAGQGLSRDERIAEWLANEIPEPNTFIGRAWQKVRDFIDRLVNAFGIQTAHGVVRDIRSGEVFEREPAVQDGVNGERYTIGQKLREADVPIDDVDPKSLSVEGTNRDIISRAAEEFKSWPEKITAADGSEILLANPDDGYISRRALHLVWDNDKDGLHIDKVKWLPNVPGTLANAAARLVDNQSGNRIYVRAYSNKTKHMVVVAPDGTVVGQEPFTGKLITQFPYAERGRQDSMVIDWERRKGEGRSQGNPNPTPPVSAVPGPRQEEFQGNDIAGLEKVKSKEELSTADKSDTEYSMTSKPGAGDITTKATPKPEGGKEYIVVPRKEYTPNTSQEYATYSKKEKEIWKDYKNATDPLFKKQDAAEKAKDWDTVFEIRKQVDAHVSERERRVAALGEKIPGQIEKIHYDEYPTNGIKNYDIENKESASLLLKSISSLDGHIGLRGIYKNEIGKKKLKSSSAWDDNSPTSQKLRGTSVLYIGETSDFATIESLKRLAETDVSIYGDTGIKAVVFSKESLNPHEIYNDIGESVFPNAQVIGYINAPIKKSDLPNQPRPQEGGRGQYRLAQSNPDPTRFQKAKQGALQEVEDLPGISRRLFDEFRYQAQDRFHYLNKEQKRVTKETGKDLPESEDTRMAETRYPGMADAAIRDFEERHIDPIIELMRKADLTVDDVGEYLQARHAPEANRRLRAINPTQKEIDGLIRRARMELERVKAERARIRRDNPDRFLEINSIYRGQIFILDKIGALQNESRTAQIRQSEDLTPLSPPLLQTSTACAAPFSGFFPPGSWAWPAGTRPLWE